MLVVRCYCVFLNLTNVAKSASLLTDASIKNSIKKPKDNLGFFVSVTVRVPSVTTSIYCVLADIALSRIDHKVSQR